MKSVNIFALVCLLLSFGGCRPSHDSTPSLAKHTIHFSEDNPAIFDPDEHYKVTKTIALETTEECLISSIDKLYLTDEYIIIVEIEKNRIFLFDKAGKFVRKIGKKGDGPKEYNFFNDIVYDNATQRIYAFERFRNKMYVYTLDGELEKMIPSKFAFNSFIKNQYGYWAYTCFEDQNPEKHLLMLLDDNLSTAIKKYFPQKAFGITQFTPRFEVDNSSGKQYFYFDRSNIIWQLSDSATPYILVDFGSKNLPYEKMSQCLSIKSYDALVHENEYVGFIDQLKITQDKVYFECRESGLNKRVITYKTLYDLNSKQVNVYYATRHRSNSLPFDFNKLVYITPSEEEVFALFPQQLSSNAFASLQDRMPEIKEDDNPILFFCNSEVD